MYGLCCAGQGRGNRINSQCSQREVLTAGSRDQLCQSRDDVIESCADAVLALPRARSSLSVCTHGVPVAEKAACAVKACGVMQVTWLRTPTLALLPPPHSPSPTTSNALRYTTASPNSKHWFTTSFLQPLPYLVTPQGPENCQLTSSFLLVPKQWYVCYKQLK